MPDAGSYTFGDCVVDTGAREIRRGGQVQATAPRVFDLIVFLIEHRRRVVPKDELLDRVWSGAFLSDSVIARAVMKARHCIGDNAAEPKLIKTIHRVGYRFMAPTEIAGGTDAGEAAAVQEETQAAVPIVAPMHRIALLPFENRTGDAQFSWVELGLLSMVNQALESDVRLSVSSVTTVLKTLELPGKDQTFDAVASRFRELLGVGWVGQATISQTETGFALSYVLVGPESLRREAVLQDRELTALGQQLARAIETAMFAERSLGITLECADPVTNQLFARYAQAFEKGQFAHALNLIRVVDDMSPNQTSVRFAHLRVLCKLLSSAIFVLGEVVLRDAQALGDERLAAFTHVALGRVIVETQGETPAGRHHHAEVRRIADRHHGAEWTVYLYLACMQWAYGRGDFEEVRILLGRAAAVSRVHGNLVESTMIAQNQAVIEAVAGNLQTARGIWQRFVQNDFFHQPRTRIAVRLNLAEVCASMGELAQALGHTEDAANLMFAMKPTDWTWAQVSELCCEFAKAGQHRRIKQVLDDADACLECADGMKLAHRLIAHAQGHASQGDFAAAAPALLQAVDVALKCQEWQYAQQWMPLLLYNDMRAGRFDVAAEAAESFLARPEIEASPDVIGLRLQARALEAHRAGDRDGARELLASAMTAMKPSPWSVRVRLDAAWLDIERGDLESARRALEGTFRWTEQHPTGLGVQARLHFACGRPAEAATLLHQAIESGAHPTPQQRLLLDAYRNTAKGHLVALADAKHLPSTA